MRKWSIVASVVAITVIIDRLAKVWVTGNLDLHQSIQPIPALAPLFQITRSSNTGAAFGILPMAGNLFLFLAFAVAGVMLWTMRTTPAHALFRPFAIGLVIGGAAGNAADRLSYGHVVDFIHYQLPGLISNVSNLADHAIVLGVLLLVIDSFARERRTKRENDGHAPASGQ